MNCNVAFELIIWMYRIVFICSKRAVTINYKISYRKRIWNTCNRFQRNTTYIDQKRYFGKGIDRQWKFPINTENQKWTVSVEDIWNTNNRLRTVQNKNKIKWPLRWNFTKTKRLLIILSVDEPFYYYFSMIYYTQHNFRVFLYIF